MTFTQLKRILEIRAGKRGLELLITRKPWHVKGAIRSFADKIFITIDSRQSPADQLSALAHEAGHLLFGHCQLEDEVWTMIDGPGTDEWEWEADYFALFALRTKDTPAEWFLEEQIEMQLHERPASE